ncbi:hypothetical protein niasHT_014502 [Heterodera trifolii]|uniref:polynucleotide adenylyltransferase n=1 Tax=Heterodera trifolii TaxID=157864 RepID=A0ABD2KZI5_9BILA
MDLIACSESATDKAAKKAHKREMMSLRSDKDKLFPEEAQMIIIEKGEGNRSSLLETEISLLSMHNEIMEGLIENEQHFLDKVKTIFIDVQRLQKMIPRMTLAYQILMENSKGSKQKKNENENNGKEDEKEKGEEKGGGREEKGEEKEKGDEKTRGREQKGGEMEPDGEKIKAEEKGEEKGEERGGADGEIEGGGEKERVRQKVGENNGGRRVENADEKIRGIEEKEDQEKRKAEEKGEERGGADGEKGEENDGEIIEERDKKGREKGSESGRAENERCVDSDADSDLISCYQHLMLADRPISSSDKKLLELKVPFSTEEEQKWDNSICEEMENVLEIFQAKFGDFHEMDRFYLALFSSTDSETTFQAEIFLGLKLMDTLIDQTEKVVLNPANFNEIITTRAKLRAMMAVQLHFWDADKFRIICYQIAYVTYLVQKRRIPFTVWRSPTECFLMDREETLSSMRTLLQPSHLNFVISQLNGGPVGDSISDTVRQKRGALALLEKLIGGTALIKLWENKEARAKLMEANCNANISADSDDWMRRDIKSADLFVWAQWFQSHIEKQHKGKSRHSLHRDYVWMYLRIAYDMYEIGTEKSEFEHTFTKLEAMTRKITKLLSSASANGSRGSMMGQLRETWNEIIMGVFVGSDFELEESVEQQLDMTGFMQQLHHRVIRELCQNIRKSDKMIQKKFGKIIKGLRESKNCRNNLTSFLNKEQIREIFQFVGIPLEEKEFENTDQKMTVPSDDQTETEKGKDQQKKKRRKNRRKKNEQKLGMIEENESEKGEEKTESKSEEKGKSEKESDEKWTKKGKENETREEKEEEKEEKERKEEKMEEEENIKSEKESDEKWTKIGEEKEKKEEKMEEKEKEENEKWRENGKEKKEKEEKMEEHEKENTKREKGNGKNQKLLNQMMANGLTSEFAGCLSPSFPKISQQLIRDEFDEQNSQKLEQFVEERAINGQTADGISRKKRDKRIKALVGTIKGMAAKWSTDKAKLLISGSFMFGLNTTDSDIDLICVVPGNVIKKEHFLGEQNEICVEKKCQNGEEGEKQNLSTPKAFYCHLCENEKVIDLLKIGHGQLMMLKFTFDGFDFDISFVAIPKLETLEHRITDRTLRNYLTKFDIENVEHRQMIRVLTSYLSNVHIIKLMDETQKKTFIPSCDISDGKMKEKGRNYENLRFLILALKLWAKANFIYSNKFGFLNGVILTIMASKIALIYPNSSLHFLLCKFFLIYAARPFGLPIQLEQINEKSKANPFLTKNPMENEIKIYTPVFPQQNAARLITYTNAKIIRKEMTEALNKLINFGGHLFDWPSLLSSNTIDFVEKYENFIVINCIGHDKISVQKFCQFVETRIRLQLAFDISNRGTTTNWHIYPALFQETCQITQKLEEIPAKISCDYHHCKVWLIGTDQQLFNSNEKRLINGKLLNFDWAIKRDFLKFNGKLSNKSGGNDNNDQFQKMGLNLKSICVPNMAHLLKNN